MMTEASRPTRRQVDGNNALAACCHEIARLLDQPGLLTDEDYRMLRELYAEIGQELDRVARPHEDKP